MTQLKHHAERLRIGIGGGWLEVSEAVEWADRQIAASPEPHAFLIEIAAAAGRGWGEMVTLLRNVPGTADECVVMRACLADLRDVLEREPALARDAAEWLEWAADAGLLPAAQFGWEATQLADAFRLADQTIGTVAEARARVVTFLDDHAAWAYSVDPGCDAGDE